MLVVVDIGLHFSRGTQLTCAQLLLATSIIQGNLIKHALHFLLHSYVAIQ